jgi:antitoxin (DNA-binding transcriptional repressor) of toxin-antitoxin stability system
MITVTTHQAKTHLSQLLDKVAHGEEVLILRGHNPAAQLVPPKKIHARRRPRIGSGCDAGVQWSKNAFAPLAARELRAWGLA